MAAARKRPSIRARARTGTRQDKAALAGPAALAGQHPTKKDKRSAKHDSLLRRICAGGVQKSKTRRPNRKLRAAEDVDDLRKALPDISADHDDDEGEDEWEGFFDSDETEPSHQRSLNRATGGRRRRQNTSSTYSSVKMVMKSLQHRPGAMKRKRQMEQSEMERFSKNLAQLSGSDVNSKDSVAAMGVSPAAKWAALRRFIGGTMEKEKAFGMG